MLSHAAIVLSLAATVLCADWSILDPTPPYGTIVDVVYMEASSSWLVTNVFNGNATLMSTTDFQTLTPLAQVPVPSTFLHISKCGWIGVVQAESGHYYVMTTQDGKNITTFPTPPDFSGWIAANDTTIGTVNMKTFTTSFSSDCGSSWQMIRNVPQADGFAHSTWFSIFNRFYYSNDTYSDVLWVMNSRNHFVNASFPNTMLNEFIRSEFIRGCGPQCALQLGFQDYQSFMQLTLDGGSVWSNISSPMEDTGDFDFCCFNDGACYALQRSTVYYANVTNNERWIGIGTPTGSLTGMYCVGDRFVMAGVDGAMLHVDPTTKQIVTRYSGPILRDGIPIYWNGSFYMSSIWDGNFLLNGSEFAKVSTAFTINTNYYPYNNAPCSQIPVQDLPLSVLPTSTCIMYDLPMFAPDVFVIGDLQQSKSFDVKKIEKIAPSLDFTYILPAFGGYLIFAILNNQSQQLSVIAHALALSAPEPYRVCLQLARPNWIQAYGSGINISALSVYNNGVQSVLIATSPCEYRAISAFNANITNIACSSSYCLGVANLTVYRLDGNLTATVVSTLRSPPTYLIFDYNVNAFTLLTVSSIVCASYTGTQWLCLETFRNNLPGPQIGATNYAMHPHNETHTDVAVAIVSVAQDTTVYTGITVVQIP